MIPVILSGGSGTRLWPLSRTKLPKQFCQIFDESLQDMTLRRLQRFGHPWIVTSQNLKELTLRKGDAYNILPTQVLLEPLAKNTAPAIAWLCLSLQRKGLSDSVVGIFPADHLIEKETPFLEALEKAAKEAEQGKVVTLGIQPTYAATGYGYIQIEKNEKNKTNLAQSHSVLRFHEKPNQELATQFVDSQQFFWNAGIFIFKVNTMIEAFKKEAPQIWSLIEQIKDDGSNLTAIYQQVPSISIDYAIMEKLSPSQLSCIPCDCEWNDVGSWDAIAERTEPSSTVSVFETAGSGNRVFSKEPRTYAFVDTNDLILVDTPDALLISKKGSTQKVKEIYDLIKAQRPELAQEHKSELRPWGQYEVLKDTAHFKSKVIEVLPHSQLSYQSHTQREEHWIVTQGEGEVVLNDQVIVVKKGTYIHIPQGSKHRMRNTKSGLLQFIEVQLGSYFGEDDIIRYQDDYQRN